MPSLAQEAVIVERFRIVECADQESVSAAARRFDCSPRPPTPETLAPTP